MVLMLEARICLSAVTSGRSSAAAVAAMIRSGRSGIASRGICANTFAMARFKSTASIVEGTANKVASITKSASWGIRFFRSSRLLLQSRLWACRFFYPKPRRNPWRLSLVGKVWDRPGDTRAGSGYPLRQHSFEEVLARKIGPHFLTRFTNVFDRNGELRVFQNTEHAFQRWHFLRTQGFYEVENSQLFLEGQFPKF